MDIFRRLRQKANRHSIRSRICRYGGKTVAGRFVDGVCAIAGSTTATAAQ